MLLQLLKNIEAKVVIDISQQAFIACVKSLTSQLQHFIVTIMKLLFPLLAALLLLHSSKIIAQDSDSEGGRYTVWKPNGIGLQYGAGSGWIVYKRFFKPFALEGNFGYYQGGNLGFIPRFQVNFLVPYDIKSLDNLQWYWGIGTHYQAARQPYFEIGGNALAGLEYNIIDWHISIYGDMGLSTGYRGKNDPGFRAEPQLRGGVRFRW